MKHDTKCSMRKTIARGFTLVELLIVIALLGVIATIVIAAINPIEQANRATDAGMKADASQIVSAIQRYYTSHGQYPWEVVTPGTYGSSDVAFDFASASNVNVGLCGASCATPGELITSNELQSGYLNKKFLSTTSGDGKIYVGKDTGASSTVFACWVPKSSSNRQKLYAANGVLKLSFSGSGTPDSAGAGACSTPTAAAWTAGVGATPACVECVPE